LTVRRGLLGIALVITALVLVQVSALAATTAPDLGVASSFAVLAGSTVTNTGPTVVSGDLGVSPGTAVTGFTGPPQGSVTNGSIHSADPMAAQAQSDLTTAYNAAAAQSCTTDESGKTLGAGSEATLIPGVYCFSTSAQLTGDLHLNGAGVYIFQVGTTLTTATGSRVFLDNGASACQVFWQLGSSAIIGTTTQFAGTVMALTSISVGHAATIEGRVLARNAAVTLDDNAVTRPACGQSQTATTLTSSANPSAAGQSVTFTSTTPGATSGTVAFYDGSTKIGTAPVSTSGQASLTTAALGAGTHTITAVFSGTSALLPSTSPSITQTVTPAPSPNPSAAPTPRLPSAGVGGGRLDTVAALPASALLLGGMMLAAITQRWGRKRKLRSPRY
jgi:hypothetical protein